MAIGPCPMSEVVERATMPASEGRVTRVPDSFGGEDGDSVTRPSSQPELGGLVGLILHLPYDCADGEIRQSILKYLRATRRPGRTSRARQRKIRRGRRLCGQGCPALSLCEPRSKLQVRDLALWRSENHSFPFVSVSRECKGFQKPVGLDRLFDIKLNCV